MITLAIILAALVLVTAWDSSSIESERALVRAESHRKDGL